MNLSTNEGGGRFGLQSIRQMELQLHQPCFVNDEQDSQLSASQGGDSTDRSEHFVSQFFKTQNKQGL